MWSNVEARATKNNSADDVIPAQKVPISSLLPADSPRLTGENPEHVELLAAARNLPPILVQRSTMRVIDGMHRVRAALLRGEKTIAVTFFEGDDGEAFLRAVDANIKHGLPLSLADREAAARRILANHPQWSDRTVATATGLSHTTVGAIRRRSGLPAARNGSRVGRDGRARPVDAAAGRRRASEFIARQPDAPLRTIAKEAGISVGTARDVRQRVRAGRDPVPDSQRRPARESVPSAVGPAVPAPHGAGGGRRGPDWRSVVGSLSRDPAVRYAQNGRAFVRWVDGHVIEPVEWGELIDAVPPHWQNSVAELARSCAGAWLEFAQELEQRARTTSEPGVA
ncbi:MULTISPECIES: ParB/RepB/Spo0J family partition protein [unclassified Streptomyces]|uniref:ParB/RepB/Spo0J family partition protein n=1 Tax=unclassified Streptomyces TaxID=2593676 RepID=UPI000F6FB421|nr:MULTISPECIES: ParB N-terminal domain-containing protein [unclassified Streptomyces]AZM59166.1 hypothetical protein DLM49_05980 [Streptomyces sp. WAC 01438]RSM96726.1 hypothetical protein DMA10_12785 [Streptomyces sp. WAC 01420]